MTEDRTIETINRAIAGLPADTAFTDTAAASLVGTDRPSPTDDEAPAELGNPPWFYRRYM